MSFSVLDACRSRGLREVRRTNLLLHLAREEKERAESIDEQRIDGALGIALFFSPFLSASSDPFVRNVFVCTEPLAESNPVLQDPISAIHPPFIYAGDNGTLLRSAGCVGSHIISSLLTRSFTHFVGSAPAPLLRHNRSLLMLLRFGFSSLCTGALMDTRREQAKRVVHNVTNPDTTTSWTAGANTLVPLRERKVQLKLVPLRERKGDERQCSITCLTKLVGSSSCRS
ncbi:hypothetical protein BHM03_00027222 [Ensete ventricosum]|nr:hypothetical protein BHM03_00027222 [Ensete ventricosum]